MTRTFAIAAVLFVAAVCLLTAAGCAGTKGGEMPGDPDLIRKEIREINNDILNTEELYKAKLTELQMEEDADRRREVNRLWIELEHLRSRKTALEERLAEIEAGESP